MHSYDAIVVGAGPAGASAAEVLACGGAKTLLLEKARLPRYKPCGGGLTPRVLQASPIAAGYMPETQASTLQVVHGQHVLSCGLETGIRMVMRDRFDAYLAEQAVAAGAELRDQSGMTSVEIDTDGAWVHTGQERLRASYLIGADGANGVTARLTGFAPPRQLVTAIEVEIAVPDHVRAEYEHAALFAIDAVPTGYAWIFGKSDVLSCGVGALSAASAPLLRTGLQSFLARYPAVQHGRTVRQRGHRIPIADSRRKRQQGCVLLAGDAAALADPLTGEGIPYALASGRRAGATVLAALAGAPEVLTSYDRYLDHELCADLRYARWLAAITMRWPGFILRMAAAQPSYGQAAADAVAGLREYRSVLSDLVRRAPMFVRTAAPVLRGARGG